MIAIIKAIESATGILAHTPFVPRRIGKINRHGIRNTNCRERESKIEICDFPIDWKKFVITIWHPTTGNIIVHILNPVVAMSVSSSFVVNIATMACGKISSKINHE